jgi:hypothetical protein
MGGTTVSLKPEEFAELFKATLSMYGLKPREVPSFRDIQAVFNQVLEAYELCSEDFKKYLQKPSSKE